MLKSSAGQERPKITWLKDIVDFSIQDIDIPDSRDHITVHTVWKNICMFHKLYKMNIIQVIIIGTESFLIT